MKAPRVLAGLLLALAASGCGNDREKRQAPDEPPALQVPEDPPDALDWVRAAESMPGDELARRLAAWPMGPGPFFDAEETQVALTWRLRLALQDGDVEEAAAHRQRLEARFEGHGVSPQGRGLTPEMIRWGLFDEAILQARRRMDGSRADVKGARSALRVATKMLEEAEDDAEEEDAARLAGARFWVDLAGIEQLSGHEGIALPHGASLAASKAGVTPGARPWVIVVADDYALGEERLVGPLERWQREGADAGLRVAVIPRFSGQVRMGIRRVPAEDVAEERGSIRDRLVPRGLGLADEMEDGPFRFEGPAAAQRDTLGARVATVLGLGPQDAAVLVVDARGRVVGRLDGQGLDLRTLDPLVHKLVS